MIMIFASVLILKKPSRQVCIVVAAAEVDARLPSVVDAQSS